MRSIARRFLIHRCVLVVPCEKNDWGASAEKLVPLSFVRIDPCTQFVSDKTQAQIQASAVLIYDCRNSLPEGIVFAAGQRVRFFDGEYTVQRVEHLYDEKQLHHIEVTLV
ncbi:MAG: putative minor capsid protein [Ruthenibacterium sp.]